VAIVGAARGLIREDDPGATRPSSEKDGRAVSFTRRSPAYANARPIASSATPLMAITFDGDE
jgi:hypothetical protein